MTAITLKTPVPDRLTDDEFFQFCADHRDLRIERNAQHQIVIMPPTNSETGASNSELGRHLASDSSPPASPCAPCRASTSS